eukprot:952537-Pyramimonas_sp.AAC.1
MLTCSCSRFLSDAHLPGGALVVMRLSRRQVKGGKKKSVENSLRLECKQMMQGLLEKLLRLDSLRAPSCDRLMYLPPSSPDNYVYAPALGINWYNRTIAIDTNGASY